MFFDWLFSSKGEGSEDDRRQLQELLSKNTQITDKNVKPITISLGTYNDLVSDLQMYIDARRDILKGISNPIEFESFMHSCFVNSLFADELASKLLACSPDPNYLKFLNFKFSYLENMDGENVAKYKEITCSPHLKLINKGSDLRIYFYWCDKDVGNGEKVLVGRIGSHPY